MSSRSWYADPPQLRAYITPGFCLVKGHGDPDSSMYMSSPAKKMTKQWCLYCRSITSFVLHVLYAVHSHRLETEH